MTQQTLGDRIRELRIEKRMSQAELAGDFYSDSYISLIEAGKRNPSPDVIRTLAGRFDCSAAYLEYGIGEAELADLKTRLRSAHNALDNGRVADALAVFGEMLRVPNLARLSSLWRQARAGRALALEASGQLQGAIAELEDLTDAVVARDWDEWADLHTALLRCRRRNGEAAAGAEGAELALARLSEAGADFTGPAIHLGASLAGAYLDDGDLLLARQLTGHLVGTAETLGAPGAQVEAYRLGAAVADAHCDHRRAVELAERALRIVADDEQVRALGRLRVAYAALLLKARPEEADRAHALLLDQHEELGRAADDNSACLVELARAEIALGSPDGAIARAQQAIAMLANNIPCRASAHAYAVIGDACARLGKYEDALTALTCSAEQFDQVGLPHEAALAWIKVAELVGQDGSGQRQQAQTYRRALSSLGLVGAMSPPSSSTAAPALLAGAWMTG